MTPPFEHILYEKKGRIAYVTINRPQVMNALHPPAHAELTRAWDDFIADDQVWVAILTGAGERAFSAGTDLKYRVEQTDDDSATRSTPRSTSSTAATSRSSPQSTVMPSVAVWN